MNRAFNSIKDFFVHFVREGLIESSPCQHLKALSHEDKSRREMKAHEFELALEKSPLWFRPVFKFLYLTGGDPSSLSRLKWKDVDFTRGVLILRRKKGAGWRDVRLPLNGELEKLMLSIHYTKKSPDSAVFLNPHGKPLSPGWCSKVGNKAIKEAGLEGVVLYSLRHGLASDLTDAGVSTAVVRDILGHANIRTTQRYAKAKLGTLENALKLVRGGLVAEICHQDATKGNVTTSRLKQEVV